MKTPNPDHPIRKTLKHLALASAMGAALYFGASPAQAQITEITPIATPTTAKIHWTNVGGAGSPAVEGTRVAGNLVNNSGISTVGGKLVHNGTADNRYSNITQRTGGLIIDLGATYQLSLMQIWNFDTIFGGFETFGPNSFDFKYTTNPAAVTTAGGTLNVANLSLFTSLTDNTPLATAPEPDNLGETYTFGSPTVPAEIGDQSGGIQSLSATTITARYIFLDDLDGETFGFGGRLGLSEIKFYGVADTSLTVSLTSPTNNQAYSSGESVSATATVASGTAPYTVKFFTRSLPIGSFAQAGVDLTTPPYTLDLGALSDGSYEIYATVTDSAGSPATDTSATRTFSVAPATATTIVLDSTTPSTYGDDVTFTATVDPVPTGGTVQFLSDGNNLGLAVPVIGGVAQVTTSTLGVVGPNEITAEYSGNSEFAASSTASSVSHMVNKAELTVTAQNVIRAPNTANPTLTAQITGFQNGETLGTSGVTGTPALSTTAVLASPIGDYPITCAVGTLAAGNYSFVTFVGGTLTVSNLAAIIPIGETADRIHWTNVGGTGSGTPESPNRATAFMVDDSGISTVGGKLVHNGNDSGAASNIIQQTGGLIIDLGATYDLTLMQIWNFNPGVTSQYVTFGSDKFDFHYTTDAAAVTLTDGITLNVADLSKFTSLTNNTSLALAPGAAGYLGETFTFGTNPLPGEIGDQSGASQSLSATTITARYIFLDDLDGSNEFGGRLGFSEIKFYGTPVPIIVGPVDDAMSTVTATPGGVVANGVSFTTVKVTLRDANGVRVANKEVTLANNGGLTPPPAVTTNEQGEANFAVRSGTIATVVFTATVVADSLTLTDTASVEFIDPQTPLAVNVNFHAGSPTTGLLGVVGAPGEIWNQGTTSASNLINSSGTVVSAINVSGANGDGSNIDAALNIFDGSRAFFSKGQDTTISITGLAPNTAYDLYIYALSHNTGSWGNFTDSERGAGDFVTSNTVLGNGQSQWLDNGLPGTNGSTFVANGNYVVFQSIVSNNLGNIAVLADAYDGLDGNPSTSDGDTRLHLSGLQIQPATGMSLDYVAWRDSSYPGLGLPDEDDDGDGLSNDFERIFGMDPTDPASSSPYWSEFDSDNGTLGYTRRLKSLINMNYKVWYSTDLEEWFEDNAALQTVESVSDDVEFMGVSIDPLLLSQPKLFVRVAATPVTGFDPEPTLVNLGGSGNSITLLFSEPMNPSSATNPANYQVLQDGVGTIAITGVALSSDGSSVTLTLASVLGNDTGYTVNVENLTSGTGQSLGTGISRQFTTWDDNPNGIKVFILAGQSNMVGFGNVETGNGGAGGIGSLRYLAVNDASYPDYNYASLLTNPGQPATSPFRTRSDVKVWWRDGGPNLGGTVKKGDLGPSFGVDSGRIGPEFAFGQIIGDFYPANNVLIVKTAWGGRSLAGDFRPPSAVARVPGTQIGPFFSAMIDYTREVLSDLDTEFPEWAGQGYQIVGFGWHQGFNDLINAKSSEEYKDNLPDLIKDVRTVFGKPNLPFTIVSTGQNPAVETPPYTGYTPLERAQLWAAGVPKPANVLSTDARPFWRDATVSPSGEGFHWNWNAETYFLIGKSLGDNMVDLLTP